MKVDVTQNLSQRLYKIEAKGHRRLKLKIRAMARLRYPSTDKTEA